MRSTILIVVVALVVVGAALVRYMGDGPFGRLDSATLEPTAGARSEAFVADTARRQHEAAAAAGVAPGSQILFGDLHVHTTISFDAFMLNLPLMGGEGAHPPADACDFARHCAALDFYSINDHASNILPEDWINTVNAIQGCNKRAGSREDPDMVAFLGWEWTQAGATPDTHYGHKNVVLLSDQNTRVPWRPIAASAGGTAAQPPSVWARGALALQGQRFQDLALRWTGLAALPLCNEGPVRSIPFECREIAETPAKLFEKLADWRFDSLVIPHGTTWGIYTPPGASWDKQLAGDMHDPERQRLIEVYSGHGESEVYRDWRAVAPGPDGQPACPPARPDYVPMCQRAGQIVETRCLAEGEPASECAARAERARLNAARAGVSPHATVAGTRGAEWLDAGQCRDCDQPAFKYRPASSAQYIAALGNFDEGGEPARFRMGFIASSDIHTARAGTGFKELRFMTDAGQRRVDLDDAGLVGAFLRGADEDPAAESRTLAEAREVLRGLQLYESERTGSFLYTGGLVAVHAPKRDRESVWRGLQARRVYGTSGPRILLWFDLLRDGERIPMGSEAHATESPTFEVRAVGSFEQLPGCPESASDQLGPARLEQLCRGECYNPGERRRPITRIEVVRIRPQTRPGEDVAGLIDDPWRVFECDGDPAGCAVRFEDPEFAAAGRETLYYVRAYEAPKPTVNGAGLRCEAGPDDACVAVDICERGDECLGPDEPRAWSSPIWIDFGESPPEPGQTAARSAAPLDEAPVRVAHSQ